MLHECIHVRSFLFFFEIRRVIFAESNHWLELCQVTAIKNIYHYSMKKLTWKNPIGTVLRPKMSQY